MEELSLNEIKKEWHGTLRSYMIGFLASLLLTAISFVLVMTKGLSEQPLTYTLIGLAIVQAVFQLIFFLHVGQEAKPRWESIVFLFMTLVLVIIAIGSLWIIFDLNNRVMPKKAMEISHD